MPAPCRWLSKSWCQPMLSLPVEASATLNLSPLNFLAVRRAVGSCGSSGSRRLQLPSPLVGTACRETLLRGSVGAGVPVGVGGVSPFTGQLDWVQCACLSLCGLEGEGVLVSARPVLSTCWWLHCTSTHWPHSWPGLGDSITSQLRPTQGATPTAEPGHCWQLQEGALNS